jgi:glucose/arabinose dehydrogenase
VPSQTPLLGNRVDRFVWNGTTLTFEQNIIRLRAFQADAGQPLRGNHDGGVLRFGPDGKLYIVIGDQGRRGQLQNLPCGPTAICPGPTVADDQFGGPEPDNAHLTGVILRLNDDGTAPGDNPFFSVGAALGGEVGANIQKIFAYGLRNSFGMAFDPMSGDLWEQENGDDSFTELNRAEPGFNSGWVQIMGPPERIAEFKAIETNPAFFGLQQIRWPPTNIADTPEEAVSRLFMLPGAHYSPPEFSWKFEVAPAGIGFLNSRALGPQFEGDLFVGAARTTLLGGQLFHFNLTGNRRKIGVDDPRLEDRVADNLFKFDITESESLLIGRDFGIGTDIQTGPNGNLFVVSLTNGAIYEIYRR